MEQDSLDGAHERINTDIEDQRCLGDIKEIASGYKSSWGCILGVTVRLYTVQQKLKGDPRLHV